MKLTYMYQPPASYTFDMPQVKKWVESKCGPKVLNLFAGKNRLMVKEEIRVDIDPLMKADYHMDAFDYVQLAKKDGVLFDTLVLDPPYNLRKAREKYGGRMIGSFTKLKRELPYILKDGGNSMIFGYDTVGFGRKQGFEKRELLVVCHSGDHNDTLAIEEVKVIERLF